MGNIKKIIYIFFCTVVVSILIVNQIHAQDELNTTDYDAALYKYKQKYQTYSFYGSPIFYNIGGKFMHNEVTWYPHIGLRFDTENYGIPYAEMGFSVRKKHFRSNFAAVAQIAPQLFKISSINDFEYMSFFAEITLGFSNNIMNVYSISKIGAISMNMIDTGKRVNPIGIVEEVKLESPFLDNGLHRIALMLDTTFYIFPIEKHYSFNISLRIPFSFLWGYGIMQTLFLVDIEYSDFFFKSDEVFVIDQEPLVNRSRIGGNINLYQLSGVLEIEQRIYFRGLSAGWSRMYISSFATAGYGVSRNNNLNRGKFFAMFGGGIGYNVKDEYPLQIQMGTDLHKNFLINVTFASPIMFPK